VVMIGTDSIGMSNDCLRPMSNQSGISWREQVTFQ
jgi:hypothetical protein